MRMTVSCVRSRTVTERKIALIPCVAPLPLISTTECVTSNRSLQHRKAAVSDIHVKGAQAIFQNSKCPVSAAFLFVPHKRSAYWFVQISDAAYCTEDRSLSTVEAFINIIHFLFINNEPRELLSYLLQSFGLRRCLRGHPSSA